MNTLPSSLKKIALFLERLPGIGEKTANRLAFHFLKIPEEDLKDFAENMKDLREKTRYCSVCLNLTEDEKCGICLDDKRDHAKITVVEDVLDLLSFETGNIYDGIYHVLYGKIDPLNHMGPEDIKINELLKRIQNAKNLKEIILATSPDMEGEATAMYIKNKINELLGLHCKDETLQCKRIGDLKITRLGYGVPIGASLEYADYMTLKKAMDNRNSF
ncbi:MAG: recombination mediator RecR [bacterium]|nr:recombination mediator RecR [bacterium]